MPVETSMLCAWPEPGAQSRLINTSICVSFVFLDIVAVLAVITEFAESWARFENQSTTATRRRDDECNIFIDSFHRIPGC